MGVHPSTQIREDNHNGNQIGEVAHCTLLCIMPGMWEFWCLLLKCYVFVLYVEHKHRKCVTLLSEVDDCRCGKNHYVL